MFVAGGGGGGSACPKESFLSCEAERKIFWVFQGSGGMLPWKIFKIKGPRLAKNTFPEISAWKN